MELVGSSERYDFYEGWRGHEKVYNIVPKGSQKPTGGFPSKGFIEGIKGAKFPDKEPQQ